MPANKMPEMPVPAVEILEWKENASPRLRFNAHLCELVAPAGLYTADQMRAMSLAGIADAGAENAKLREMLADCTAYVAARDAYEYEAEKYGHESNQGEMIELRAAVMAAVKKYRLVLANLTALEQEAKK